MVCSRTGMATRTPGFGAASRGCACTPSAQALRGFARFPLWSRITRVPNRCWSLVAMNEQCRQQCSSNLGSAVQQGTSTVELGTRMAGSREMRGLPLAAHHQSLRTPETRGGAGSCRDSVTSTDLRVATMCEHVPHVRMSRGFPGRGAVRWPVPSTDILSIFSAYSRDTLRAIPRAIRSIFQPLFYALFFGNRGHVGYHSPGTAGIMQRFHWSNWMGSRGVVAPPISCL